MKRAATQARALSFQRKDTAQLSNLENSELVIKVLEAVDLPRTDGPLLKSDPFVRMWISDGSTGEEKGPKVEWASRYQTLHPVWNSARSFGVVANNDRVHIEMWDVDNVTNNDLIGRIIITAGDLRSDAGICTVKFKIRASCCAFWRVPKLRVNVLRDLSRFPKKKRLFIVRHGQSEWNRAQAEKDVVDMLSDTDHPLDQTGIDQALALQKRLSSSESLSANEKAFLEAQVVCSSPLTRAVQTALIGVAPVLARTKELVLLANAREKRNFGGRDSSGKEVGDGVKRRALKEMTQFAPQEVAKADAVKFDTFEVREKWWMDHKEKGSKVDRRIHELVHQIHWMEQSSIILVGHSHFFREFFEGHLHPEFASKNPQFHEELTKDIIMNCGVASLELDFEDNPERCIKEVELMFGSTMIKKH